MYLSCILCLRYTIITYTMIILLTYILLFSNFFFCLVSLFANFKNIVLANSVSDSVPVKIAQNKML